jgi:CRP-like cAMP-binding protein
VALITEQDRLADVYAETDVIAYTIRRDKFLNFIAGTEFEKTLLRLARIRTSETWNLLSASKFFQYCTSSQKTWLESIFIPMERSGGGVLIREGDEIDYVYILREGAVDVSTNGAVVGKLTKGDFIGSMRQVHASEPSLFTFSHAEAVSLFAMRRDHIVRFLDSNPGF